MDSHLELRYIRVDPLFPFVRSELAVIVRASLRGEGGLNSVVPAQLLGLLFGYWETIRNGSAYQ